MSNIVSYKKFEKRYCSFGNSKQKAYKKYLRFGNTIQELINTIRHSFEESDYYKNTDVIIQFRLENEINFSNNNNYVQHLENICIALNEYLDRSKINKNIIIELNYSIKVIDNNLKYKTISEIKNDMYNMFKFNAVNEDHLEVVFTADVKQNKEVEENLKNYFKKIRKIFEQKNKFGFKKLRFNLYNIIFKDIRSAEAGQVDSIQTKDGYYTFPVEPAVIEVSEEVEPNIKSSILDKSSLIENNYEPSSEEIWKINSSGFNPNENTTTNLGSSWSLLNSINETLPTKRIIIKYI